MRYLAMLLCILPLAAPAQHLLDAYESNPPQILAAAWTFADGAVMRDYTRNRANGTWSDAVCIDTGVAGGAVRFAGAEHIFDPLCWNRSTYFTITFWYRTSTLPQYGALFYNGHAGANGYGLYIGGTGPNSGSNIRLLLGGQSTYDSGVDADTNGWHFVALRRSSALGPSYISIDDEYIAGTVNQIPLTPITEEFNVGSLNPQEAAPFTGDIDEIVLWPRFLSEAELKQIYEQQKALLP